MISDDLMSLHHLTYLTDAGKGSRCSHGVMVDRIMWVSWIRWSSNEMHGWIISSQNSTTPGIYFYAYHAIALYIACMFKKFPTGGRGIFRGLTDEDG